MGLRSNPVAVSLQIFSVLAMVNLGESSASQLTCNVTRNRDNSVSYTLEPAPNASSYSWSNSSNYAIANEESHTDAVQSVSEYSLTLKGCDGPIRYSTFVDPWQEVVCHVNCSALNKTTEPMVTHVFCLSENICGTNAIAVVSILVFVLVLVPLMVIVYKMCKRRWHRCKMGETEVVTTAYTPVKISNVHSDPSVEIIQMSSDG